MKKLNYLIVMLAFLIQIISCDDNELGQTAKNEDVSNIIAKMDKTEAQKEFARLLSKAVFENQPLRALIKDEALKQFDKDYDVFYPLIKNKEVENGKTVRDLLLSYCDDKQKLSHIEETLPLLNFYVPDFSLFHDFTAENWDVTDNEIAVTPLTDNFERIFYGNGDSLFTIEPQEIPGFPCLVVKDNDRLKVTNNYKTRSTLNFADYEFIDSEFDGRKEQSVASQNTTRSSPYDWNINDEIVNPSFVVRDAFLHFGTDPIYWQRDHIYFGMTKNNPKNGQFNPQIREYIHKIKIHPSVLSTISDQNDPNHTTVEVISNNKDPLTWAQIVDKIWTDGNFEFKFYVYMGRRDATLPLEPNVRMYNVSPKELFRINKVKHRIKGRFLRKDKHTYWIESMNDVEGVWHPLRDGGLQLEQWDIANGSMSMTIRIEENDPSQTVEKETTIGTKYTDSNNFKIDMGLGGIIKKIVKLDLSYGYTGQKETNKTERTKWITTLTSDPMGTVTFYFSDPVLKGYQYYPGFDIYNGYSVGTGYIDVMLLPRPI